MNPNVTANTRSGGANNQRNTATDNMLFLMVLANVCTYIITQIPYNAYRMYYAYQKSNGVGFYLFSIASPQFRKQFLKKILFL